MTATHRDTIYRVHISHAAAPREPHSLLRLISQTGLSSENVTLVCCVAVHKCVASSGSRNTQRVPQPFCARFIDGAEQAGEALHESWPADAGKLLRYTKVGAPSAHAPLDCCAADCTARTRDPRQHLQTWRPFRTDSTSTVSLSTCRPSMSALAMPICSASSGLVSCSRLGSCCDTHAIRCVVWLLQRLMRHAWSLTLCNDTREISSSHAMQ